MSNEAGKMGGRTMGKELAMFRATINEVVSAGILMVSAARASEGTEGKSGSPRRACGVPALLGVLVAVFVIAETGLGLLKAL